MLIPSGAPHLISARPGSGDTEPVTRPVRAIPLGRRAVLAEVADTTEALSLARWARRLPVAAEEIVPGARTVLFDGVVEPEALAARLADWQPTAESPTGPLVEIPVHYDGADLADVAQQWGMSTDGAVAAHTSRDYVVAFCGFAPGFAYLTGLPSALAVSRLASPRTRVPAGAVAVADQWCGVYPRESPGGWRLLGSTDASLWDPGREPPALLAPGTRVRFVAQP